METPHPDFDNFDERLKKARSYAEMNDLFLEAFGELFETRTIGTPDRRLGIMEAFTSRASRLVDELANGGSINAHKVDAFSRLADQGRQVIVDIKIKAAYGP